MKKMTIRLSEANIRTEIAVKTAEYLPRIMAMKNASNLNNIIDDLFSKTKATRFLILIGVNGKYDLNHISCVWYKYKNAEDDVNPISEYKHIDISQDNQYKKMLSSIRTNPESFYNIKTMGMEQGILKDIYFEEQITHAKVGYLGKENIDKENDAVMFFSIATDNEREFSDTEKRYIRRRIHSDLKQSVKSISPFNN